VATGGSQHVSTPGLAAGESVTIYSTVNGIPLSDTYTAVADFSGVISESNESNNSLTQKLPLGTLPTCTPPPAVGGVSELIVDSRGDAGTSWSAAPIAAASAASLALAAAAWYMRKRRLAPD
jgi:hypothetical protein